MILAWAEKWGIPRAALVDLAASLTHGQPTPEGHHESYVQSSVRLEAARTGRHLFRNNVGAARTDTGSFVRFGLGNDSSQLNAKLKSADLIGFETLHVYGVKGEPQITARFLSVECKHPGWRLNPNDEREQAQLAWAMLVNQAGGRAIFATGPGAL